MTGRATSRSAGRLPDTVIYEAHVRGFTAHPNSGVDAARRAARTPGSSRRSRTCVDLGVTAVELLPVYQFDRPGRARRAGQLLGLPAGLVLRARTRRTAARPGRPGGRRRVPGHGQGAPPGRPRGHPRRRLQPHRRGRRRRPDVLLPRASPTTTTTSLDDGGATLRRLQRLRQHAQCGQPPIVRRLILDSLRYWVRGDARRRLPVRPRRGAVARRGRASRSPTAGHLGHRDRPGPGRHQADRRGLGRGRPVPGRQRSPATAGASGTAASATTCARSSRATRATRGRSRSASSASPDIYGHRGATPQTTHQLRDLPRRLHAQRPGLLRPQAQRGQRRGQPRRQRRQPQLELRRRGPDRRPGDRGAARAPGPEPAGARRCSSVGRADAADGRRGPADAGRQQQRLLPGQRATWFDWAPGRAPRGPASLTRKGLIDGRGAGCSELLGRRRPS